MTHPILTYHGHEYYRVSGQHRCPHCGKPDWCLWAPTNPGASICQRAPFSEVPVGEAGFYHAGTGAPVVTLPPRRPRPIRNHHGPVALYHMAHRTTTASMVQDLADDLGLPPESTATLSPAYMPDLDAWAFPMRNADGAIIGIRMRNGRAEKWALTDSHNGLFIPTETGSAQTLWLPEGPTSTIACHAMGLRAIGRPSTNTGFDLIDGYMAAHKLTDAVCLVDEDEPDERTGKYPGLEWSCRLAERLLASNRRRTVRLVMLPCKDARVLYREHGGEGNGIAWSFYDATGPYNPSKKVKP